jgi:hypothetical protein
LVVTATIAPLVAEPRPGSEQVSQRLAGHRVRALEARPPWVRVRGSDGYEGWVHSGYLLSLPAAEVAIRYRVGRISLGCVVRDTDGVRRPYPVGAILRDQAHVERGTALPPDELRSLCQLTPDAVVHTAVELFSGAPYQWGGITPWGADCSGLAQACFGLHGVALPRDAAQQAAIGQDAGLDVGTLRPADLLFFSDRPDGRITHVGIAAGGGRMVHLALGRGGYAVEDLSAPPDRYVAALVSRFRFARRIDALSAGNPADHRSAARATTP